MKSSFDRRGFIMASTLGLLPWALMPAYGIIPPGKQPPVAVAYQNDQGRVILSDSLTYLDQATDYGLSPVTGSDVIIGGSFAGIPTFAEVLKLGVRGVIAHEAGVGKDQAGIGGLKAAQTHNLPAAAVATFSARISDGRSVARGIISHLNEAARSLGIRAGMSAQKAARLMLNAEAGSPIDLSDQVDHQIHWLPASDDIKVAAVWSIGLIEEPTPNTIFCVASHAGQAMANYALPIRPRALFANDAGIAKNRSGVKGLITLERNNIPAAAVTAHSARIGDALSTYREGICSVVNRTALRRGVRIDMPVRQAIEILLTEKIKR